MLAHAAAAASPALLQPLPTATFPSNTQRTSSQKAHAQSRFHPRSRPAHRAAGSGDRSVPSIANVGVTFRWFLFVGQQNVY